MTDLKSMKETLMHEEINQDVAMYLDHFYVYRSLHSDESWGAMLAICQVGRLPNIDFGMKIYAKNEKEAIARAKDVYERVHKFDSEKDNVRRFAAGALKSLITTLPSQSRQNVSDKKIGKLTELTLKFAISMNEKYTEHFNNLREQDEKDIDGT